MFYGGFYLRSYSFNIIIMDDSIAKLFEKLKFIIYYNLSPHIFIFQIKASIKHKLKHYAVWIATPCFARLAMTERVRLAIQRVARLA